MKIKRFFAFILAATLLTSVGLVGCSNEKDPASSSGESSSEVDVTEASKPEASETEPEASETEPVVSETEPEPPKPVRTDFEIYQSNTPCATGHNKLMKTTDGKPVTETYRGVFRAEECGTLEYKFFFSNNVDGSSQAFSNYRGMPTSPYKIISAFAGSVEAGNAGKSANISNFVSVTFGGETSRDVKAGEKFWSDAVEVTVPEGGSIIFEWTIEYTAIPGTIIANTYPTYKAMTVGSKTVYGLCDPCPMPDLIGADRGENNVRVAFLGDSITEGTGSCKSRSDLAFWVAKISEGLGTSYSVWNLGLDSGRANDVITGDALSWIYKAKQCDVLAVCVGINDTMLDVYYPRQPRTADQVFGDIKTIIDECHAAGCDIIIFSMTAFEWTSNSQITKWQTVNAKLKAYAEENNFKFFDFAAVLCKDDDPTAPAYGGHPNAEGCTKVAEAFIEQGILPPLTKTKEVK